MSPKIPRFTGELAKMVTQTFGTVLAAEAGSHVVEFAQAIHSYPHHDFIQGASTLAVSGIRKI